MQNNSLFVKIVIWFMVFLMSVGFAGLVVAPFVSSSSIFGNDSGRDATQKLLEEARADIKRDGCSEEGAKITGKRLERCQEALTQLASSYMTLASTPEDPDAKEAPRDAQRNLDRAGEAFKALYMLDTTNTDNAARYAGFLRDSGKSEQALDLWTKLVKENPGNEDYLLQLAGAYQQTNAVDKSITTLQTFVKKFPDSGQLDQIKEQIKQLQDQQKEQAASGGAGAAGGAGGLPINIG